MPLNPIRSIVELLSRDSRARAGAEPTISYLLDLLYFGEFGILEQVASGVPHDHVNLIGRKGPATGKPLWLIANLGTSMDAVPAKWNALGGDPFNARFDSENGRVIGLGAHGGKVDLALKIAAASRFATETLHRPIYVAALSGEEAHGSGARMLLSPSDRGTAIIHAPTGLRPWTDHPGCVVLRFELVRKIRHRRMPPHAGFFEIDILGTSAHTQVATPLIDDALARGLEVISALRAAGDTRVLSIEGGESANRIPGRCTLRVATGYEQLPPLDRIDRRITSKPIEDGTALPFPIDPLLAAWLTARDAGVLAIEGKLGHLRNAPLARPTRPVWTGRLVSARDSIAGTVMLWTGPGVESGELCERFAAAVGQALKGEEELEIGLEVVQDRPAFAGSEGAEGLLADVTAAMRAVRLAPEVGAGCLTSDAGLFRLHGLDALAFGAGGPIEELYQDDESIAVAKLESTAAFYEQLIARMCT